MSVHYDVQLVSFSLMLLNVNKVGEGEWRYVKSRVRFLLLEMCRYCVPKLVRFLALNLAS